MKYTCEMFLCWREVEKYLYCLFLDITRTMLLIQLTHFMTVLVGSLLLKYHFKELSSVIIALFVKRFCLPARQFSLHSLTDLLAHCIRSRCNSLSVKGPKRFTLINFTSITSASSQKFVWLFLKKGNRHRVPERCSLFKHVCTGSFSLFSAYLFNTQHQYLHKCTTTTEH